MTLAEIKFDIIKTVRSKYNSDDVIDETHIEYLIREQRELWIRNKIREFSFIPEDAKQILKCVPLIDASTAECCEIDIKSDCTIKRSRSKIPRFANLVSSLGVTRISSVGLNEKITIQYVKRNRAAFTGLGRFNRGLLYAFLLDDYLYIVDGACDITLLQAINIEGIFADPLEAANLMNCDGESCFDIFKDEYPLPGYLTSFMKGNIIQQLVQELQIPADRTNDSSDEIKAKSKQPRRG